VNELTRVRRLLILCRCIRSRGWDRTGGRMNLAPSSKRKVAITVPGIALVVFLMVRGTTAQRLGSRISIVSDWSHQHLVFSAPQSTSHPWQLQGEPRYWHQWARQRPTLLALGEFRARWVLRLRCGYGLRPSLYRERHTLHKEFPGGCTDSNPGSKGLPYSL
jgi:hypothetical protein